MKVNEIEKILQIPRSNIRFYEKEGLIHPERCENGYRNYTDSDIITLRKIIIFRKLGFSIEEIRDLQNGAHSLEETLKTNRCRIEEQINMLKGAMRVVDVMLDNKEEADSFDPLYYMDIIEQEEIKGNHFFDIAADYAKFEFQLLDNITGGGQKSIIAVAGILLVAAIVRGIVWQITGDGFLPGFLEMLSLLVVVSIVYLPAFILRKRKKAAQIYINTVVLIGLTFLALICLAVIILLINSKFHFLF